MLGSFFRLAPPRFSSPSGGDAYEVLNSYVDRLHTLGLVETRGIDYTIFQLDLVARC